MPDLKDMTLLITGKEKAGDLMDYEMDAKAKEKCMGLLNSLKEHISKEGLDPKSVIMSLLDGDKPEQEEEYEENDMGDKEAKKRMLIVALKKGEK